jgi:hypothetical protein
MNAGERRRSSRTCSRWMGEFPFTFAKPAGRAFSPELTLLYLPCMPFSPLPLVLGRVGEVRTPARAHGCVLLRSTVTESLPNAMFRVTLDANDAVQRLSCLCLTAALSVPTDLQRRQVPQCSDIHPDPVGHPGSHFRQDKEKLHQDPSRGQGHSRNVSV